VLGDASGARLRDWSQGSPCRSEVRLDLDLVGCSSLRRLSPRPLDHPASLESVRSGARALDPRILVVTASHGADLGDLEVACRRQGVELTARTGKADSRCRRPPRGLSIEGAGGPLKGRLRSFAASKKRVPAAMSLDQHHDQTPASVPREVTIGSPTTWCRYGRAASLAAQRSGEAGGLREPRAPEGRSCLPKPSKGARPPRQHPRAATHERASPHC